MWLAQYQLQEPLQPVKDTPFVVLAAGRTAVISRRRFSRAAS